MRLEAGHPGFPRGIYLPPRLPAVMDGFISSRVRARNAPAASFKILLGKHIKPDGWWQSVTAGVRVTWFAATHNGCWSKLLVALLWPFRACFSAVCEMLLDPFCSQGYLTRTPSYWGLSCEALQDIFGGEDPSSSPPFTPSDLSANKNSHLTLTMLLLRALLYLCFINNSHQQHRVSYRRGNFGNICWCLHINWFMSS